MEESWIPDSLCPVRVAMIFIVMTSDSATTAAADQNIPFVSGVNHYLHGGHLSFHKVEHYYALAIVMTGSRS